MPGTPSINMPGGPAHFDRSVPATNAQPGETASTASVGYDPLTEENYPQEKATHLDQL